MTELMFQDFTAAEFAQFFDSPSNWETYTKTKVRRSVQLKGSSKEFKELVILKMETLK
tara:strand:+ start:186 stop:359 length:174 start_codon:yes stop_codon:yes gene_type:complete